MNVVLAGGGTAGHVEPALALADALRRRDPDIHVWILGTTRGLETRLVPARGYPLDFIPPVPMPRHLTLDLVRVPFRLVRAVREARLVLRRRRADVVVGFGGYVALPAYLAARRAHVPYVVHEANARPGLANRIGARRAAGVAVSHSGSTLPRARLVGIPLRPEIASLDRTARHAEGAKAFGLSPDRPTLLAFGGSQGARRLNTVLLAAMPAFVAGGVQVLHATGTAHYDTVTATLAAAGLPGDRTPYVTRPYLDRMDLAYAAADLALCRGGALTVAEVTAVGLPAVVVPLPVGNGEQRLNAADLVAAGGALLVDDAALDAAWLTAHALPLLRDSTRLAAMSAASHGLGRPDAADALADLVIEAASRRSGLDPTGA